MAAVSRQEVDRYVTLGKTASDTVSQGRAFEDLVCYIFGLVPGVTITHRDTSNAFRTEEVDVALWNDQTRDGFFFLPHVILVECKNWSQRVGSSEVNWFDSKLRNRGLDFGILITTCGITGDPSKPTAAHSTIATSLREGRRLVVISTAEIEQLTDSSDLVLLIKKKLCDLAVRGAVE